MSKKNKEHKVGTYLSIGIVIGLIFGQLADSNQNKKALSYEIHRIKL